MEVILTNLEYRATPDNFCGSLAAIFWIAPSSLVEPVVLGGIEVAIVRSRDEVCDRGSDCDAVEGVLIETLSEKRLDPRLSLERECCSFKES